MGKGEKGGVLLLRDDTRVAVNRDGHGRKPQRTPRGSYVLPTLLCFRKRKGPTVRWTCPCGERPQPESECSVDHPMGALLLACCWGLVMNPKEKQLRLYSSCCTLVRFPVLPFGSSPWFFFFAASIILREDPPHL